MHEQSNAGGLDTLGAELDRMRERERATQEILRVISESRADEMPVLEAIVCAAVRLCNAKVAGLSLVNESRTKMRYAAIFGADKKVFLPGYEFDLDGPLQVAETVNETRTIHTADLADDPLYRERNPIRVKVVEEAGVRTFLTVPLVKDGVAFGCLNLNRSEVRPFSDDDIALIETFAKQAAIAIENVRQFREVQDRLTREAATREILEVISTSRDDAQPVFDAILKNAARLCDAPMADLDLVDEDGQHLREVATWGPVQRAIPSEEWVFRMDSDYRHVVATREGRIDHVPDLRLTERYLSGDPTTLATVQEEKMLTLLAVPLLKAERGIGCLVLFRQEQKPFTDDEIALVETFAAQAVIAIENVRQFREVQTRLEREAASRNILQVISQSRDDEKPTFNAILENACRLCHAQSAFMAVVDETGDYLSSPAQYGASFEFVEGAEGWRVPLATSQLGAAITIRERRVLRIDDVADTDLYRSGNRQRVAMVDIEGIHSILVVPLLTGNAGIGAVVLYRKEVRPFSDDEVALVETFAAQAVIAIENVRQFKALESLSAELSDRVEEQVGEIERMGRLRRFLPSAVADTVVSSGSEEMLKSHRALLGVLFCDIRGFTAFCETAEPEETIEVLQTYHEEMGKLINAYGAGVDHRMGDGIMVLFNDPIPCDDPAGDAARLAIAMRERMAKLCVDWKKLGHRLGFGVGVSLGYATVGIVGFEERVEYSASGTAVNLASRLCDEAQDGEILLSPRARMAVEGDFQVELKDELTFKGIREPVEVFRLSDAAAT